MRRRYCTNELYPTSQQGRPAPIAGKGKNIGWPGGDARTFAEDVQEQLYIFSNMRWLPLGGVWVVVLLASDNEPVPGDGPVHVHDIARDMLHSGWA